jgi:hypothetical protein
MTEKLTETLKAQIKLEFIEGLVDDNNKRNYPSIDELSKRHNVAIATLYRHSKKEDWQKSKNQYQSKIEEKIKEKRLKDFVRASERLDESCLQISQGLLNSVGRKLQRMMERQQENPSYEGYPNNELREMSNTVINAQRIGKLALGEAQEISKVSANVTNDEDFQFLVNEIQEINRERSKRANHTIQ